MTEVFRYVFSLSYTVFDLPATDSCVRNSQRTSKILMETSLRLQCSESVELSLSQNGGYRSRCTRGRRSRKSRDRLSARWLADNGRGSLKENRRIKLNKPLWVLYFLWFSPALRRRCTCKRTRKPDKPTCAATLSTRYDYFLLAVRILRCHIDAVYTGGLNDKKLTLKANAVLSELPRPVVVSFAYVSFSRK